MQFFIILNIDPRFVCFPLLIISGQSVMNLVNLKTLLTPIFIACKISLLKNISWVQKGHLTKFAECCELFSFRILILLIFFFWKKWFVHVFSTMFNSYKKNDREQSVLLVSLNFSVERSSLMHRSAKCHRLTLF